MGDAGSSHGLRKFLFSGFSVSVRWILAFVCAGIAIFQFIHVGVLGYSNVGRGDVYDLHRYYESGTGQSQGIFSGWRYDVHIHVASQNRNVKVESNDHPSTLYRDAQASSLPMQLQEVEVDTFDNEVSRVQLENGTWVNAESRQPAKNLIILGVVATVLFVIFAGLNIPHLLQVLRNRRRSADEAEGPGPGEPEGPVTPAS